MQAHQRDDQAAGREAGADERRGLVAEAEFIAGLASDARRQTSDIQVAKFPERRALVRCTVVKWASGETEPPEDAPRYDNVRLFWRTDANWTLLSWVNEPLS